MNRYKSDDTCEALGVAKALPAPAGHLWEKWSSPLAAACYPPSCPAEFLLITLINVYVQPQGISRDYTLCVQQIGEETAGQRRRKSGCLNDLYNLNTHTQLYEPKISGFFPRILPPGPYGNSSPRPKTRPPPIACSRASRAFKITGMATSKWLQIPVPACAPELECLPVCGMWWPAERPEVSRWPHERKTREARRQRFGGIMRDVGLGVRLAGSGLNLVKFEAYFWREEEEEKEEELVEEVKKGNFWTTGSERRAESGLRHEKVGVSLLDRQKQQGVCVRGSAAGVGRGVIAGKMAVKAADLTYYGRRLGGGISGVIDIITSRVNPGLASREG
ncbi:hypothetical protein Baya_13412 [Bagarius yarrelli]|uniref:Uncharacterized protein n=1 Tax=Bagarius yarrelli TaxID=175774 RepID=A0A556V5I4_BAGYA|nr:hypothetical protein Baya_13412 [Bagarius yarrelli]